MLVMCWKQWSRSTILENFGAHVFQKFHPLAALEVQRFALLNANIANASLPHC